MKLTDLVAGNSAFVDANLFIYYFMPHPTFGPACADFLERIENQELTGYTSALVMSEVAHRLMALEAIDQWGWPATGMAHRLKRHPDKVQQLSCYRLAVDEIAAIGIQVLSVSGSHVSHAADFSRQFGLLTNDALVVAVMREHGLIHLASSDGDFDTVPGLSRYAPT